MAQLDDPKERLFAAGFAAGNQQILLCVPIQKWLNMLYFIKAQYPHGKIAGMMCWFSLELPCFQAELFLSPL